MGTELQITHFACGGRPITRPAGHAAASALSRDAFVSDFDCGVEVAHPHRVRQAVSREPHTLRRMGETRFRKMKLDREMSDISLTALLPNGPGQHCHAWLPINVPRLMC